MQKYSSTDDVFSFINVRTQGGISRPAALSPNSCIFDNKLHDEGDLDQQIPRNSAIRQICALFDSIKSDFRLSSKIVHTSCVKTHENSNSSKIYDQSNVTSSLKKTRHISDFKKLESNIRVVSPQNRKPNSQKTNFALLLVFLILLGVRTRISSQK